MGLSVFLLGPLDVRRDGASVAPPMGRQRTILAMLMLNPQRGVSRARLATELYGDAPPASAAANLRSYVSGLRQWLAATAVPAAGGVLPHGDGGGWSLSLACDDIDVRAFESDLVAGRQAVLGGDWQVARRRLSRAVRAFRDAPLVDVAKGPVLTARATLLTSQWFAAVEEYADVLLRLGRYVLVQELLVEFLAANPTRERAWGQLMLACYRAGDTAEALRSFRTARAALLDLLGMEPGEGLDHLHRQILSRDPSLGPIRLPGHPGRQRRRVVVYPGRAG
ncbi:BTAD domain-containing putative transcriptional regulator [Asanoa sp. NPDC049518]|uniref:AfsR/SARP family transcriptional regulator n=1 Tax=unclassified Asanoa TaxID=2685164 RepID=UPI00344AEBAF